MGVKNVEKAVAWSARMAAFEASGQRRRVWCAAQGLNVNTFAYWHRRLGDLAVASSQGATSRPRTAKSPRSPAPATALVPVLIRSQSAPSPASLIEFEWPGGLRLRTTLGVNTHELSALVRALSPC